jgi:hypothetical protein
MTRSIYETYTQSIEGHQWIINLEKSLYKKCIGNNFIYKKQRKSRFSENPLSFLNQMYFCMFSYPIKVLTVKI